MIVDGRCLYCGMHTDFCFDCERQPYDLGWDEWYFYCTGESLSDEWNRDRYPEYFYSDEDECDFPELDDSQLQKPSLRPKTSVKTSVKTCTKSLKNEFHQKKNLNGSKTSRSPKNRSSPKKNRFLMNDFSV